MRYARGSIQISPTRDIPLLRQIMHCVYATKPQLYQFMELAKRESSLQSLQNRLQRLVRHELVKRHEVAAGCADILYSITQSGVDRLMARGEPYAGRGSGVDRPPNKVQHAIELNDIHLALRKCQVFKDWMPESEICSRNILTSYGYVKDYDAVVTFRPKKEDVTMALEYERSQKTDAEYRSIATTLSLETQVDFILYLVTTRHLFAKVVDMFQRLNGSVAIGMAQEFRSKVLDANVTVMDGKRCSYPTVRELLDVILSRRAARSSGARSTKQS